MSANLIFSTNAGGRGFESLYRRQLRSFFASFFTVGVFARKVRSKLGPYCPVAQRQQQRSVKPKVVGSIPTWAANRRFISQSRLKTQD